MKKHGCKWVKTTRDKSTEIIVRGPHLVVDNYMILFLWPEIVAMNETSEVVVKISLTISSKPASPKGKAMAIFRDHSGPHLGG